MFFFPFGINQNVIDENNDKLIQEVHKNLIHEVHEIRGGIGLSKRHDCILIQSISGGKCSLWDILCTNLELMITSSKINLRKHLGTGQLIKQIFYLGQGVLVLDGDIIQLPIIRTQAVTSILLVHK